MKKITITVENGAQADVILELLEEAEEENIIDFSFNTQISDE